MAEPLATVAVPRLGADSLTILLDNSQDPEGQCHLFENAESIVACSSRAELDAALETIGSASDRGLYAAGFLSYELGYLQEPKLAPLLPEERAEPLIYMGLFRSRQDLSSRQAEEWLSQRSEGGYELSETQLSTTKDAYLEAFQRVKDYIAAGDIYQINLTFKHLFQFSGNPLALYGELRRKQRMGFGGVILAPDFTVLSLSPELFLSCKDGKAMTRPMKGTAARGRTRVEDKKQRDWLRDDEKSRAENLMIVDLLRNDLGRVAKIGSVRVPSLFEVETYPTLHQMTSTVTAELRDGIRFRDLVRGLFPCGSITGAPKVRAMEIIRELETEPRGVYTGAIGMIEPEGDLSFNVSIRTLMLKRDGTGELGIGSGVVYDSDGPAEFEECILKSAFLTRPYQPFQLTESLRWQDGSYFLLPEHLERLAGSASHFQYPFDLEEVQDALATAAEALNPHKVYKVRLLLNQDGLVWVTAATVELPTDETRYRFVVSGQRVDSGNALLYHKTTQRDLYEGELKRYQDSHGCSEVLFLNERGELCEGARCNIFLERDGELLTPAAACGLLPGTFRRSLLEGPDRPVREAVLTLDDLKTADAVYFGNSVRGLVRAEQVKLTGEFE